MKVLVTGSSGLVGSEIVRKFATRAERVVGADNNLRADFFGPEGDTRWNLRLLTESCPNFHHRDLDLRDRAAVCESVRAEGPFDLVVHAAAQPSHDLAARRPFNDFDVNAVGTLNILEAVRLGSPEAVFVHMSTNKVYGDAPNEIPLVELEKQWDYARPEDRGGVREDMRVDRSLHSIFGASKAAADLLVQEYGRYFGMRTTCLRCGCITGPQHAGVELHGFLSYLVKTQLQGREYHIYGYKGKQVRDNIHSYNVALAVEAIYDQPRQAEIYNLGGGRENSCSVLEALELVEQLTGRKASHSYEDAARRGDHICYISNLERLRTHYPEWRITRSLDAIFEEIVRGWTERLAG